MELFLSSASVMGEGMSDRQIVCDLCFRDRIDPGDMISAGRGFPI